MAKRIDAAADKVVRFINNLTHSSGEHAREPFNLRPWQERIIRQLFATDAKTKRRKYRTALLMLPRKNGKSELAAAIALYGLIADGEIGGQVILAAADRDQASLVYSAAVAMVEADPRLDAKVGGCIEIIESQKRMVHRASGSVLRAIAAEAFSKHGFNASMVIYDELHSAPNRELWDVLRTSQGARSQPIMLAISTAGYDRESILFKVYDYASKVRDGVVEDPSFLPIIYEMAKDADWTNEREWFKCNPALDDFRSLEDMRILAREAKEMPDAENAFRRLYGNQWTEQATRWMPMHYWDACAVEIDWNAKRGKRCYVGMDLSSTRDLTALVAVFPNDDDTFDVLPAFFVPKATSHLRSHRDRVQYEEWGRRGHMVLTEGDTVDYEAVRKRLHDWRAKYDVREIGYDRYNATDLVNRLTEVDGFKQAADSLLVPIGQGYASMSAPTKELERAIVDGFLRHDGHPVLTWCISNAAVEQDPAGNVKLSKKASIEKIDGAIALAMAMDRMSRNQTPSNVYLTRGVRTLGA